MLILFFTSLSLSHTLFFIVCRLCIKISAIVYHRMGLHWHCACCRCCSRIKLSLVLNKLIDTTTSYQFDNVHIVYYTQGLPNNLEIVCKSEIEKKYQRNEFVARSLKNRTENLFIGCPLGWHHWTRLTWTCFAITSVVKWTDCCKAFGILLFIEFHTLFHY